ncbi:MAG TPA: PhzF family phenazine biosynthesis protein [Solirubrobacteraceae bacterium]|nr:PhzF family phenazine biosynthesis protein [Solirubrobacteraceae bacterium]
MNGPRHFAQVDVFGDDAAYGNPVAVVIDGDGLDDAELQRFANWTNLSETTFLLPPTKPGADYRVRIFTPSRELPFAGHPTLGSAHAWLEASGQVLRERVVQECGAGLIEVRRGAEGRLAFAGPPLTRSGALDDATLSAIVASLGISRDEVVDHAWTDNGPGWATVLLASAERVLALAPSEPGESREIGVVGLHPDGTPEVRAFVIEDGGYWEDPVTGSLNAGVAEWLLGTGRLTAPYVARQGTALGRSGRVHVSRTDDGTVWVGGQTRTVLSGSLTL